MEEITCLEAFAMFVEYLYTCNSALLTQKSAANACDTYGHLYQLADYLMMDSLRQIVIEKMEKLLKANSPNLWAPGLPTGTIVSLLLTIYYNTNDRSASSDCIYKDDDDLSVPYVTQDTASSQNDEMVAPSVVDETKVSEEVHTQPDPMRSLVARYAASQLKNLLQDKGFMHMIARGGDLATDILSFVQPGKF